MTFVALVVTVVVAVVVGRAFARHWAAERQQVWSDRYGPDLAYALHAGKVARIAQQLRAHRGRGRPVSLRKRAVAHQVPKPGDLRRGDDKIDISDLNAILAIDPVRKLCVAESGVTFVDLVAATMRYGLVPIIVPELKTITVGGAVSGCSIESMSFREGGFHDTCVEYEVITAGGEVLTCTADNEHRLVFQMMHGSFGTLGILSRLTFRLIEAKPFVRLRHERYHRLDDYLDAIWDHYQKQDIDFMDGIVHSPTEYVLSAGRFVDRAPYTNRYDWTKVFWRSTRERHEDFLHTADYFFRYDRGVTSVHPKSWLGRLVFGKFMGSAQVLRLADRLSGLIFRGELTGRKRPTITLDVLIPFSKVPAFLAWYTPTFGHFPLWCVPYRRVRDYEWLSERFLQGTRDELFVDLAIYGMEQHGPHNYHRLMEEKLAELGGVKTLIAHNYYGEDEFWEIWNRRNYERVKARTDPDNLFRDLYTKTCKTAMGRG
ncbi:MAG TPA: FAD-binding oxidoreductase [Kofleriaceae bacterium]|jgi:FAD/FMN-containing dehydrogenase|nr:FAD-binding oxidoreductase [Kofleriaceae bacterium]